MTNTTEIRIENSTICSYKCSFCPHKDGLKRGYKNMDMKLFNHILNEVEKQPQIKTITLSGLGEPFSDNTILEKINECKKRGFTTHTLTNSYLLTNDVMNQLIELELDVLRISFHYINSEKYTKLTNTTTNTYKQALKNTRYAISIAKGSKTKIIITSDMEEKDDNEIEMLKTEFKDANLLEVWRPHNWINWGSYRKSRVKKKTCGRPFNGPFQVQVDGTMNMCCFDWNGELEIGDLKTQTIEEIYSSEAYNSIKECHTTGDMGNLICSNCDQLYDVKGILLYNSKYTEEERINRTSTTYSSMEKI